MNSVELVFIYKYDKDKNKTFIFNNIELSKNDVFLTGKHKNKNIYSVFEKVYLTKKNNISTISTDISSIHEGFVITYPISLDDKYEDIINKTFEYTLNYFYCIDLKNDGEDLILQSTSLLSSPFEFMQGKVKNTKTIYTKRIIELLINYKLNNKEESKVNTTLKASKVIFVKKKTIKNIIDDISKKVIGQDEAIKVLVPTIMLNEKLIEINDKDLIKTQKSNILIDGSTGVGKTLIIEELAKLIDIPIVITGITNYSAVGYKGSNLIEIISTLISKANGDIEKAQKGIICLDEIDKLGDTSLEMRKAIEQELLTWINGTTINVQLKDKNETFDTSNITFVCLGAFGKMREERTNNRLIGFNATEQRLQNYFDTDDFIKFGMQREFMGRFNTIITLNDLTIDDYKNILLFSDISPLKSFIDLANIYGVEVTFDEEFLDIIAQLAIKDGIGARALQRQMNKIRNKFIIQIMDESVSCINLTSDTFNKDLKNKKSLKKDLTMNS